MIRSGFFLLVVPFVVGGCSTQHVANTFGKDFGCPPKEVTIKQLNRERYEASGCAKRAVYRCASGECRVEK